jgi:predicted Na+-dependent transporter
VVIAFFSAMAMPFGRVTREEGVGAAAIVAGLATLSPLLAASVALALGLDPETRALMALTACAPISPGVGALAAILNLPGRGPMVAALLTSLISPLVLWAVGLLFAGDALPVSAGTLAVRMGLLVMLPSLLAFGLRHLFPARTMALCIEFRGLVVLGLSMFAAARGEGMAFSLRHPLLGLKLGVLAFAVTACAMLAGWLITRPLGRDAALSGTMAAGMRSAPAAWAAIGIHLDQIGTTYMTLTVLPFYVVPLVMRLLVAWRRPVAAPARQTA